MAAHEYLEDLSSLLPAVGLLSQLGYRYLTQSENLSLRGGRTSRLILESVLREQLRKFNSITFKGQQYAFSDSNIQKALQALTDIPFDSLMNTSEQVYDLLTLGKSLEQTIDGYTKSYSLHYIDWQHPENNVYHVCDEFVLERRNSKQTRRPDILLFVNGIPLAVIECKRPDLKDAAIEGSRKRKISDASSNIFVLVDESHRSQYGVSHAKMQNVFPNACYIGFTGTPLLKKEKTTAAKFGGFIHKYTMNQAVADGAVTPLLYEGRMSELHGDKAQIDKWFERITKDLTTEQKADLKKKFRREEELSKSDQRLAEIAYDIGQHFKDNYRGTGKKGQFAVSSKAMALRYKKYFDEFGDVTTEVVISPPDTREGNQTVDEDALGDVQVFWKAMMAKYGNDEKYQESIFNAFKYSDDPEILIVVDKLLTGFDAPRNSVLYLDKRLKEHNILQAIARVNRLFEGKDYGLIIDYRGIFCELNDAIDTYAALENESFDPEDVEGTLTDISEEIKLLPQRHTNVWEVFKEVENQTDLESMQRHLEPEDRRQRFYEVLSLFAKTLQLALANAKFQDETPEQKIARYKDDLKYFLNLRQAVKQRFGETVDYSAYETQIRNMVNKYIGADAVKQLIAPVNVFAIDEFEHEIDSIEGDAAKADAIASWVKKTITEKMEEDPALYKRLSELIDEAIAEHRAKRLSEMWPIRWITTR